MYIATIHEEQKASNKASTSKIVTDIPDVRQPTRFVYSLGQLKCVFLCGHHSESFTKFTSGNRLRNDQNYNTNGNQ